MAQTKPAARVVADREKRQKTSHRINGLQGRKSTYWETEHKRELAWKPVNEITWKLFAPGSPKVQTNASHGKWAGFQTERALAWVYDTGWTKDRTEWTAVVRGKRVHCSSLKDAKAAAVSLLQKRRLDEGDTRTIPLNLLGGFKFPDAEPLDAKLRETISITEMS